MAIIYTYPVKASPVDADLVLISDSADSNNTKQVKVSSIRGATVSGVADVNISAVTSTLSSGAPLVSLPNSGNVIITSRAYAGAANVGHVPTGGSATTFLRGDGSWIVPTNTTYDIMGSGNSYAAGLVLAGNATHNNNFLRKDGTWASPPSVTPGTPLNSIQFNNASSFSGDSGFIFTNVGGGAPKLTIGNTGSDIAGMIEIQSDENGGVLKIGGGSQIYYTSIKGSENDTASYDIILPTAGPGGNNKILESTSTGVLSWITTPTAGAVTSYTNGADNRVLTSTGTTGVNGESGLLYDGESLKIKGTVGTTPSLSCTLAINDAQGPTSPVSKVACVGLVPTGAQGAKAMHIDLGATYQGIEIIRGASNANNAMLFKRLDSLIGGGTGATTVGSVVMTNSSTAFNTTSDYRLKENVIDMTGAVDRIKQLKPSRFNFISEAATVDGFLAHEAAIVVPESVTGAKDEVDADGSPIYQGIDQAKLVPLLVGAIKELTARIEALEA